MDADRATEVATLLREAELAHAEHEAKDLGGVYDQEWPRWYATYAVEHGIADILGRDITIDALTAFLARSYEEFASAEPKPADPWADVTARRITAEM